MSLAAANILRGSVSIQPGALALNATTDTTVAFNGAEVGDKPVCSPVSGLSSSAAMVVGPPVTLANVITVRIANLGTTTVAGGTVVASVSLIKSQGEDNVP